MSTNDEGNSYTTTDQGATTSTSNAQTTTTTDGNTQSTTTDGNTQVTSSPAASNNNQNTNQGGSAVTSDNGGQSTNNDGQEGGGLGVPVIVGIVVGSVAVVLMIAAFVIWYRRTKRYSRSPRYDTSNNYTGTTSSRKEYGDRVYSHALPVAVPISGDEYFEEITSTEILGRRSQMDDDVVAGSWNDPEILEARIPTEKLRVQQLLNRGGFGEVFVGTHWILAMGLHVRVKDCSGWRESHFFLPTATMREYSLESLKNDTDDVVSTVKDPFAGSSDDSSDGSSDDASDGAEESEETPVPTPGIHHAIPAKHGINRGADNALNSPSNLEKGIGLATSPKDAADSYIYDYSGTSDQFATTAPSADITPGSLSGVPTATPTLAPTPKPTSNASAFDTARQVRTSDSSSSLSGGAIAGVVVAAACVMLMVAMFVTTKKRKAEEDPHAISKNASSLGDSGAVPLASSRLAPLGVFGTLASGTNRRENPNMSNTGIFTLDRNDPFAGGKKQTNDSTRGSSFFVEGPSVRGKTEIQDSSRGTGFFVIEHDEPTVRGKQQTKEGSTATSFFAVDRNDPFTRQHMRKGGIWDDPVLVAARVPLEKIRIQELLARGGFGQVFLGSYNGETVAVKTLLPETAKDMVEINALFAETKVMAKLEHPCIVRFVGIAWESLSSICCVTEYLVGGDLRALLNNFLTSHTRPRGYDQDKVKIALDVVHGLAYLHSMEPKILHRDLKSRNVLLTSQLNAKLTDFGVSREHSDDMMTNAVGTSLWMAPEVMMGGHYDCKADVYSFGIMLSELDTHFMPYANARNENGRKLTDTMIMRKVAAGELQVEFSRQCPVDILALAQACISVDPKKRPSALEAMRKLRIALEAFEEEEVAL
ncbi:hypothetical protein PF006_g18396 [Phytophthora fragariae]|uniref:Protein kinase domain-containing protein n=1 Tax=Phytophthora fragariae TaxID=53985 RepID=A0A6A3SL34_9STRA|nr:hypothetical protein PF006_g18396 [Phytophthora fragariae]